MPATTAEGQARQPNADPLPLAWRFWVVTLLVGVGAGLAGGLLTLLLHAVQDVAFGYRAESFQLGVERAPAWRRVVVPALAGLVAGLGWWWLRGPVSRRLGPARGVSGAVWDPHGRMGLTRTFLDGVLQIVIVAMGASLGREGAPREVSAALASRLAEPTGLSAGERRVLIACGAGAGLAAVRRPLRRRAVHPRPRWPPGRCSAPSSGTSGRWCGSVARPGRTRSWGRPRSWPPPSRRRCPPSCSCWS